MMKRVRYFTGQLLSAADLQAEQDYTRDRLPGTTGGSTAGAWSAGSRSR
jgi:hypothetical protein